MRLKEDEENPPPDAARHAFFEFLPHISYLISHISYLISHISYLISHISYLIPHTSYLSSLISYSNLTFTFFVFCLFTLGKTMRNTPFLNVAVA